MRIDVVPSVFAPLGITEVYRTSSDCRADCPFCGRKMHFVMWEKSRATGGPLGWCRKCFATWQPKNDNWKSLTDAELAAIARERERREQEEQRKRARAMRALPAWRVFHENLARYPRAPEMWRERYGVNDWSMRYYRLGYCPSFQYWHKKQPYTSDTLVVPFFEPQTMRVTNMRHRLLDPDARGGKYRPHRGGLGQPMFFANLNRGTFDYCLIVEGAIKAIIIWQHIIDCLLSSDVDDDAMTLAKNMQIVGVTGNSIAEHNLPRLASAKIIYLMLDPDQYRPAKRDAEPGVIRLAERLGVERCRLIALPGKPDDLLVEGSMTVSDLRHYVRIARRICLT